MAVGQSLGGPWTYIAPAAGFGIGLVADMKFMGKMHHGGHRQDAKGGAAGDLLPARATSVDAGKVQQGISQVGETSP